MIAAPEPTVAVSGLTIQFAGKAVLEEVNLALRRGQLTVIVGPSGSGKTTLLRSINRLNECFPYCRTEGSVRLQLDGRNGNIMKIS